MSEGDGNGGLVGLFMHVLIRLLREASPEVTALLSRIHPGSTIDQPRRHQAEAISAVRCVHFLRRIAERGVVWRCDSHRRAVQPRRKSASARRFRGRRRVCDSNQTVCQLQYGTVACIASTARTPLAVFRRAPLNAWLCSTPRGGSKRVDARKVKSTHVSRHRWVWKAAGVVAYHLRRQVFWAIASALRM